MLETPSLKHRKLPLQERVCGLNLAFLFARKGVKKIQLKRYIHNKWDQISSNSVWQG
uniref:Uncharacterized protein n=1 Tax=Arion vulgaris TaxID=1028688 RepID=A0A0B7AXU9_9EUPU